MNFGFQDHAVLLKDHLSRADDERVDVSCRGIPGIDEEVLRASR